MNKPVVNKPIRVCFVVLKAYPLFNPKVEKIFGGAEVDAYFLATELAKDRDFEVSFVVGDYGQEPVELREGVTVIKSIDVEKKLFLSSPRLWSTLHKADSQIYIRKGPSLGTALVALFCKANARVFICRTSHADECDGTYLRRHWFRGKAFLWSLGSAKAVLTQNETDSENLLAVAGINSVVIRNGHRLEKPKDTNRDIVLWVGRSADFKRAELFLELAKEVPQQRFVMICREATDDKSYHHLVSGAKQIENLEFIPGVPFCQVDGFFQQARVFVNTSEAEGFPNTFIQACKSATPILSLNVDPDGFVDKYGCGLCAQNEWGRFVDMLRRMLNTPDSAEFGANGRRYFLENHNVSKIVEQYKEIFRRLIAN